MLQILMQITRLLYVFHHALLTSWVCSVHHHHHGKLACQIWKIAHGNDETASITSFISSKLSFFHIIYLFFPRPKHQLADLPDDVVKKPPFQLDDSPSTVHHCEITSSRLPTLPEEETSDPRTLDPVTVVREEADGKDDTAEVNLMNTHLYTFLYSSYVFGFSFA